jgi:hypothetical protein
MILGYTWKYYGFRGDEDIPTRFDKWVIQWYPRQTKLPEMGIDITKNLLY